MMADHIVDQFVRGRRFTHADVVRLTDVPPLNLQAWANRRVIIPEVNSPGRQGRREYTPFQVVIVRGCRDLTERGLQPTIARRVMEASLDAVMHEESGSRPPSMRSLGPDGPIFHSDVADYLGVVCGPVRDASMHFRLIRRGELGSLDFTRGSLVVVPIGEMLVEVARRAAALDAGEG
jgi:hypothetical protein